MVVETEGTNESLADLQDRCGPGVFPPRPRPLNGYKGSAAEKEGMLVFRVLREKRWVFDFLILIFFRVRVDADGCFFVFP